MVEDNAIQEFVDAIKEPEQDTNRTYSAIVSKVDQEGTVWVHLVGSEKETPTASTSTEVQKGDAVTVEWRNNKLYIAGNYSNPAAGLSRVVNVESAAQVANQAAQNAVYDAGRAKDAADSAQSSATEAKTIAEGVEGIAKDAQESADSAKQSADTAFNQLGIVENIVGVLDLISKNGDYQLTTDTMVIPDKWYFKKSGTEPNDVYEVAVVATTYALTEDTDIDPTKTYYTRSGTAPDYVYTPVENPVVADIGTYYEAFQNPSEQGLYELVGIDESIQNYVSSHLVLTGDTLSLKTDGSDYRLDLTSGGMQIVGPVGGSQIYKPLATYGTDTIIGDQDKFHVRIDGEELGFYDGNVKVAYVRNNQLFIERSVVVEQMDIGYPYGEINPSTGIEGKGQWSWKVHDVNGRNNLYLKWLG